MKKVMIFGTFDILHSGHENYIKQARELGETIVAIIARDKTVQIIKGEKAKHNEKERLKNIIDSGLIDEAYLGNLKDKTKIIKTHNPQIIALGYDQFAFTFTLEKMIIEENLDIKVIRLKPFRPDTFKSSILKAQEKEKIALTNNHE